MKYKIDTTTWKRREHYEFFNGMDDPFWGTVVPVDFTECYLEAKKSRTSFFLCSLHRPARIHPGGRAGNGTRKGCGRSLSGSGSRAHGSDLFFGCSLVRLYGNETCPVGQSRRLHTPHLHRETDPVRRSVYDARIARRTPRIHRRTAGRRIFRTAGKPRMKSGSGIRFLFLKDGTKQMKKILNKFINLPFDSHTRKNEENPARPAPAARCSADPRKHSAPSGHQFSRKLHASGRHRPLPEPVRHGRISASDRGRRPLHGRLLRLSANFDPRIAGHAHHGSDAFDAWRDFDPLAGLHRQ